MVADDADQGLAPGDANPEVVEAEPVADALQPYGQRSVHAHWHETRYASPLPSPDDLRVYQELVPDAAERLLAAGEREQQHRHDIESRLASIEEGAMPRFFDGQRRGHWISLVATLGYEGLMALAILEGYGVEGVVGAAAGIGAMVWAVRRDTDADDVATRPAEDDAPRAAEQQ